jgi:hypothetical protein
MFCLINASALRAWHRTQPANKMTGCMELLSFLIKKYSNIQFDLTLSSSVSSRDACLFLALTRKDKT